MFTMKVVLFSRTVWFERWTQKNARNRATFDANVPAYEFKTDSSERIRNFGRRV